MLIKEIKNYLSNKRQADLGEILFHLDQDKEVVLHALHFLIKKGLVEEKLFQPACKGCYGGCSCYDKDGKIYKLIR